MFGNLARLEASIGKYLSFLLLQHSLPWWTHSDVFDCQQHDRSDPPASSSPYLVMQECSDSYGLQELAMPMFTLDQGFMEGEEPSAARIPHASAVPYRPS